MQYRYTIEGTYEGNLQIGEYIAHDIAEAIKLANDDNLIDGRIIGIYPLEELVLKHPD